MGTQCQLTIFGQGQSATISLEENPFYACAKEAGYPLRLYEGYDDLLIKCHNPTLFSTQPHKDIQFEFFKILQLKKHGVVYFILKINYSKLNNHFQQGTLRDDKRLQHILTGKSGFKSKACFDYESDASHRIKSLSFIDNTAARQLRKLLTERLSNDERLVNVPKTSQGDTFIYINRVERVETLNQLTEGDQQQEINQVNTLHQH